MSEIKVDTIGPRVDNGTLTIGASGDTVNIAGTAGTGFPTPTSGIAASAIDSGTLADARIPNLNASKITAGIISAARLGSGTASSSTVLYGDGTFKAEPGGANTPAFEAYISSSYNITDATAEKVSFNTEVFDTASAYDTSAYRFTPQSAGKYYVYVNLMLTGESNDDFEQGYSYIYKNGSSVANTHISAYGSNAFREVVFNVYSVVTMNGSSDYVEAWGMYDDNDLGSNPRTHGGATFSRWGAFKIIE